MSDRDNSVGDSPASLRPGSRGVHAPRQRPPERYIWENK